MKLEQKLRDQKEKFRRHGVKVAYLHGSYAEGRADEKSDLDVAVLFRDYEGLGQVIDLEGDLEDEFDIEVDVTPLNIDDIVFKKEVVQKGIPVFSGNELERVDFETRVFNRYLDMKPYIDRYRKMRSERLEGLRA